MGEELPIRGDDRDRLVDGVVLPQKERARGRYDRPPPPSYSATTPVRA
jgi:hypothetical protein